MTVIPELPSPGATGLRPAARSALLWNTLAAGSGFLAQLAQLAWLARALPPDAFGAMGVASLFLWLGQGLSDLGLALALLQKPRLQPATLRAAYGATLLASFFLAALLYLVAVAAGAAFFSSPGLPGLLLWLLPCFPLQAFTAIAQAGMQRALLFKPMGLGDALAALLGLIAAALGLRFFGDARALALSALAMAMTRAAIAWIFTPWRPAFSLRLRDLRPLYPFGAYQILERAVNFLVGHLDKIILGRLLGPGNLGFYTVAYQLALRPMNLLAPIAQRTAAPLFARLQNEPQRLRPAFLQATRLMAHAAAPLHLLPAALATPLIRIVLGPEWQAAVPVFQALCLWGFLLTSGQPAGSLLPALGRAGASLKLNVAAVLTYGLAAAAGSRFGGQGIAWGLVLGTALVLLPYDGYLRRQALGLGLRPWVMAVLPPALIGCVSALVAYYACRAALYSNDFAYLGTPEALLGLISGMAAGLAVWSALIFFFARPAFTEARDLLRPQAQA